MGIGSYSYCLVATSGKQADLSACHRAGPGGLGAWGPWSLGDGDLRAWGLGAWVSGSLGAGDLRFWGLGSRGLGALGPGAQGPAIGGYVIRSPIPQHIVWSLKR